MRAVNGDPVDDGGVRHGSLLVAYTDAVMANDTAAIKERRSEMRNALSDEEFVDVAAIIAAFNVVTRIADATGIPLDPMLKDMSAGVREELDLGRFASAANTR